MVTDRDAWYVLLVSMGLFLLLALGMGAVAVGWIWLQRTTGEPIVLSLDRLLLLNALLSGTVLLAPIVARGYKCGWQWRAVFRWCPVPSNIILLTVLATLTLNLAVSQLMLGLMQSLVDYAPAFQAVTKESRLVQFLELVTHRNQSVPLLILGVMLPALPEELAFRGVIQQGFEHRYSPAVAILLTSIAFAMFHLDPVQSVSVLPTSLFWSWVALRSHSVLPTVIAHACQNGLTLASLLTVGSAEGQTVSTVLTQPPDWRVAAGALLLWIAFTWQLRRRFGTVNRGVSSDGGDNANQGGTANGCDGSGSADLDGISRPAG